MLFVTKNTAQTFDSFVEDFGKIDLPIDSVHFLSSRDTIDVEFFNWIIWDTQPKEIANGREKPLRPKQIRDGELREVSGFGKANDVPMRYQMGDGTRGLFRTRVYPIARVLLRPGYISLIVKIFNSEISYFDLHNFTPDGKRLSAIPLLVYYNEKLMEDAVGYVTLRSSISADGTIYSLEDNRGLQIKRVYRLSEDGYFEVIEEEVSGKFEY